jgi:hypothetical protein
VGTVPVSGRPPLDDVGGRVNILEHEDGPECVGGVGEEGKVRERCVGRMVSRILEHEDGPGCVGGEGEEGKVEEGCVGK